MRAGRGTGLLDLFGERGRWPSTLKSFLWLQCSTLVQGFTDSTDVDLPLPCTFDFEVAASKYLNALRDGMIPLELLFSGTVFTRGATGFGVEQVPWDPNRGSYRPVEAWRRLMDALPQPGLDPAGPRRARGLGPLQGGPRPHLLGGHRRGAAGRRKGDPPP